jgi:hypothetical protein
MSGFWGMFRKSPGASIRSAAKSGTPTSTPLQPTIPISVPGQLPASAGGVSADVTVSTVGEGSALDTQPDARRVQPTKPQPQPEQ